ncbi:uncharacterized protein LACBIDRAFT_299030 [Laccaria bicolor S238N-H82]|uniref:Predicted protein n=1 Tax=Laccaria bicolor (strain S238N-H82 / ATCC MYA-4686) TaxID=486041 RepID=B0DDV8_LACBS|nr:uncharacterized protein LACBIDRAFT_299030 [Laccaria bicolor S238N-H82]EDR07154.1 predicted protein [Laccaria bicolor S238N-H82]|eukprot:XP_001882085.1 predicted protein [Laccaria bicolor S238N-H82]
MVQHTPDIYLNELQDFLERRRGVIASLSCIWTALKRSGYSMKKLIVRQLNIVKPSMLSSATIMVCSLQQSKLFLSMRALLIAEHPSVPEPGLCMVSVLVSTAFLFVVATLSINGMIHIKIVEGSFTASLFYEFIEGLLDKMQPFPLQNSVIVMDNACIHKDPHILDLIEECGMQYQGLCSLIRCASARRLDNGWR